MSMPRMATVSLEWRGMAGLLAWVSPPLDAGVLRGAPPVHPISGHRPCEVDCDAALLQGNVTSHSLVALAQIGGCRVRRREFIALVGGAVAWPLAAIAQQGGTTLKVGILIGGPNDAEHQKWITAFRQGLEALGWIDERNSQVQILWAAGDVELMRTYAA